VVILVAYGRNIIQLTSKGGATDNAGYGLLWGDGFVFEGIVQ
jgi:hypothetical protein